MSFKIEELKDLFLIKLSSNQKVSINTDSRSISKDQIFLPLVGDKFNGHDFINEVFDKNKTSNSFCEKKNTHKVREEYRERLIIVDNTLDAYHKLANFYRKKINPRVVVVTGSSGKTTVKDLISTILAVRYQTHKTEANYNNEFGVPKTILEMPENTKVLVLELAMRGIGEIKYLAKTALPDIAVITNVGTAHIGRLGSTNEIIRAKCEVFDRLKDDGTAVLHNDPDLIKYADTVWKGKKILFSEEEIKNISFINGRTSFSFEGKKYCVNAMGLTQALNSVIAIKVASLFHMTYDEIQKGLLSFQVPRGRGNVIELREDRFLIDEAYNANPNTVKAAVSNLIKSWGDKYRKILVLGELAELGDHEEKLLAELGGWLERMPVEVITVGDKLKQIKGTCVRDIKECCAILNKLLLPKTVVLVKGSHVASLEEVVKYLCETYIKIKAGGKIE